MVSTALFRQAFAKSRCCVMQAGTGSPTNNVTISSSFWQHIDSLSVTIGWQQPHAHLLVIAVCNCTCHMVKLITGVTKWVFVNTPIGYSLSEWLSSGISSLLSGERELSGSKRYGQTSSIGNNQEGDDKTSLYSLL